MRANRLSHVSFPAVLSALLLSASSAQAAPGKEAIEPILKQYCFDCHGYGGEEGGMALDKLLAQKDPAAHRDRWLRVWRNLRSQIMPPSDMAQPSREERARVIDWIERAAFEIDPEHPDPGRVTVRRLNRQEYHYTILDLLGVDFNTTVEFPVDDTGYGFDTVGAVLSLSPLLVEKYYDAAQTIVDEAVPEDHNAKNYKRIFFDGPPSDDAKERKRYARKILRRLASRAFRRPVDEPTLDRLVALAVELDRQEGQSFEDGVAYALTAILVSPRFLFRAEIQPEPNNPGKVARLDEFALASRLSYFLWSSLPDDELFDLARENKLREQLPAQVERMLKDPRSERFVRNFVGQWLQTRDVLKVDIDARRVLGIRSRDKAKEIFNRDVRRAMRDETEMLFAYLIKENRSLLELLTADYTFLNEPLAKLYGIEGVVGDKMRKVSLSPDDHRGGILTHGSLLLVTSNPTRTSPVKRGLFLLDNVLAAPPTPPPPPNLPTLEDAKQGKKNPTMRELMEIHRAKPLCASCHSRMDPLGLALENYNAIGQWRAKENGKPIDTSGTLLTGESFDNVEELAHVLATERRLDFYRCVTEKMWVYALGRGVQYFDAPSIEAIVKRLDRSGGKAHALIGGIVNSPAFQMRRGDGER